MKARRKFVKAAIYFSISVSLAPLFINCSGFKGVNGADGVSSIASGGGGGSPSQTGWSVLKVGAGGYLSGIDIADDGTKVVRTDTYGSYIWNESLQAWRQLATSFAMPASFAGKAGATQELRIAPSMSSRLYMAYLGTVFRSDDKGVTWTKQSLDDAALDGIGNYRTWGQKLAVDPINPDVVYLGTPDKGVYQTVDGGATWNKVTSIPNAGAKSGETYSGGYTGIAFDKSSGVINGKTKVIYVPGYNIGVYRSADAGATWSLLNGGPQTLVHGKVASDGSYYGVDDPNGHVWRYKAGAWQDLGMAGSSSIAIHPQNPQILVAVSWGGSLSISRNGGSAWTGWEPNSRTATDIPWLAWTNENYMSAGDIEFDPTNPNRLWFAEGIGAWSFDLQPTDGLTNWISHNTGIEQLVTNIIIAPPGGKPLVGSWDRPVFRIEDPDVYPSTHGPDRVDAIQMGWGLDYASSDPNFVVGLFNWWKEDSGYSTDGGKTWNKFASYPPLFSAGKIGGSIAASTPQNIVWVPNNGGRPYYTIDGGMNWSLVNAPNAPADGSGYGWAYYFRRISVAADRVLPKTFYLYNYTSGLYRSTDGGVTWTNIYPQQIGSWTTYNIKMRTVPGYAGHLFFTSVDQNNVPLMRSTDGGTTWTAVANTNKIAAYGFGKAAPGKSYPTIFAAGLINGVYGIYRSIDDTATWEKLGDYPYGWMDGVSTVEGDMDNYGRVYVGFGGSGSAYGQFP